jgi:hypothetical protein
MNEAEVHYQEAINTHRWGRKTHRHDRIYAFKAEESETEVEEEKPTDGQEIKALAEQLKKYAEIYTAKWASPNASEVRDKQYAWKLIPPKDNEPISKEDAH